ncbi:hypothetical protein ACFW1M_30595 [Streptomyces inhibens]|uniref:hypothetical protein n=1 Tax=Streptomyces inhibens TaxID=2293571 RepID=UPI0036CFC3D1
MSAVTSSTLAWLLAAVFLSLAVALLSALLKTVEGARPTAATTSAATAFAGSMGLCLAVLTSAGFFH